MPSLKELAKVELPFKSTYQLSVIMNKVNEFIDPLEKMRMELVKKYGERNGDGNYVVNEKVEEFTEKLDELFDIEVGNWAFNKIRLPEDITIAASVINPLVKAGMIEVPD